MSTETEKKIRWFEVMIKREPGIDPYTGAPVPSKAASMRVRAESADVALGVVKSFRFVEPRGQKMHAYIDGKYHKKMRRSD